MVEHLAVNEVVVGSSPTRGAKYEKKRLGRGPRRETRDAKGLELDRRVPASERCRIHDVLSGDRNRNDVGGVADVPHGDIGPA